MQFSNGVKPTVSVDRETVRAENETNQTWFNGQSGIYTYKHKYYIIGADVFLEYSDLAIAKRDWFGKSESEIWEQVQEEGELINSFSGVEKVVYEDYFLNGLYYRIHHRIYKTVECSTKNPNTMIPVEDIDMIELPGLPARLSSFMFPAEMDESTEIHYEADVCYWFLDEGEFQKTLFSSAEQGLIPEVRYVVKFKKEYFIVTPSEFSVRGRFSSIEAALQVIDYAVVGTEPYEEIDYVRACLLDRTANDEEVDYIADAGLFDFIEMNAEYEGSYEHTEGMGETCSYDIFEFFGGYFVLDCQERSVLGKFTSYESAYDGANDEYGEYDEEPAEYEEDDD